MFPELIQTKFFTLNTLWFFIALGIVVSTIILIRLSIKNGLKLQFLSENSFKLIVFSIIGARIFSIIFNYQIYFSQLSTKSFFQLFYFWDKGLDLWGALLAFTITFYFLCKKSEDQDFYKWLDVFAPAVIIGMALGHIGAFFDGVNYGNETSLPWGVNFESPAIKYTVPIHPTQIYAFVYSLLIGIGLIFLSKNPKIAALEKKGFIGILGIIVYQFMRFLEEFVRGDDTVLIFGIRLPQILALILSISAGIFLFLRYNKPAKPNHKSKTRKPWKKSLHS